MWRIVLVPQRLLLVFVFIFKYINAKRMVFLPIIYILNSSGTLAGISLLNVANPSQKHFTNSKVLG